ncbi:MAG: hypothetical protein Q6361_03420, partial [Candidatus Hermodarchaeota archaeon]|nr:hypothetical protein [Candidatus Hermodarchaeota archaeon]
MLQATQGTSHVTRSQLPELVHGAQFVQSLEAAKLFEQGEESEWIFSGFAKVQVAIRALQLGEAARPILKSLTWQEFEEFVSQVCTY